MAQIKAGVREIERMWTHMYAANQNRRSRTLTMWDTSTFILNFRESTKLLDTINGGLSGNKNAMTTSLICIRAHGSIWVRMHAANVIWREEVFIQLETWTEEDLRNGGFIKFGPDEFEELQSHYDVRAMMPTTPTPDPTSVPPAAPKPLSEAMWRCGICQKTLPKGKLGGRECVAIVDHFTSHYAASGINQ